MTPHYPLQPWVDIDTSSIGNFRIFHFEQLDDAVLERV